jgi:hypothetical protein
VNSGGTSREGQDRHGTTRKGSRDGIDAGSRVEETGDDAGPTEGMIATMGWEGGSFAWVGGKDRTMLCQ